MLLHVRKHRMILCTYCGEPADTRDHIIPWASQGSKKEKTFENQELTSACLECNVLLGDKLFVTIPQRAAYLLKKIPQRYKKVLRQPEWTLEELKELGPSLRQSIEKVEIERLRLRRRILHLEMATLGLSEASGEV